MNSDTNLPFLSFPPGPHPLAEKDNNYVIQNPCQDRQSGNVRCIILILLSISAGLQSFTLQPCEENIKNCLNLTQYFIFYVFLINILKKNIVQNMTLFSRSFRTAQVIAANLAI